MEVPNPPSKKIRLQELEVGIDGIDNLSQNGEGRVSVIEDGSTASKNSNLNVCNVCLGILQEFCEKEFIKKVNNLFLLFYVQLCRDFQSQGLEFLYLKEQCHLFQLFHANGSLKHFLNLKKASLSQITFFVNMISEN